MVNAKRVFHTSLRWLARAARVSAGLAVVGVGVGLIAVRVSYARAEEAGLNFGDELRQMGEHHISGEMADEVYRISLNGQSVETSSAATRRPMREVLDYFQEQCSTNGDGLGDELAHLSKTLKEKPKGQGHPGFLVVRKESEDRSFVFCIGADHELTAPEKLQRLKAASVSGDLGLVGDMRYVLVAKDPVGASVMSIWTKGKLDLNSMFPKVGDAPGEDIGGIPRPEGSRRTLTSNISGAPFGVNTYEVKGEPADVLASVEAKLTGAGWKPAAFPSVAPKSKSHFYTLPAGIDLAVNARAGHGDTTSVSYVVSLAPGSVSR